MATEWPAAVRAAVYKLLQGTMQKYELLRKCCKFDDALMHAVSTAVSLHHLALNPLCFAGLTSDSSTCLLSTFAAILLSISHRFINMSMSCTLTIPRHMETLHLQNFPTRATECNRASFCRVKTHKSFLTDLVRGFLLCHCLWNILSSLHLPSIARCIQG